MDQYLGGTDFLVDQYRKAVAGLFASLVNDGVVPREKRDSVIWHAETVLRYLQAYLRLAEEVVATAHYQDLATRLQLHDPVDAPR
jgi:hypothetical protein